MSQKQVARTEQRRAWAREFLEWYGPGTVQYDYATRELEMLAQVRDDLGNGKEER